MDAERLSTHQKALQINLEQTKHGTFAEIGAGQEVVRWFFQVGGATGTVAKTISAYDMAISDAIYGPCARYVSRQRLGQMLEYEYALLIERLRATHGAAKQFFVFANTVATHSYSNRRDGHGWMGIRFQPEPQAAPAEIVLHVRLLDHENAREQEAIGVLGVNLIHGAFAHHAAPRQLIASLHDNLSPTRVEIDMIRFSGPCFAGVDNRLMSLQLVEQGFTDAALFTAAGEVAQPAELLYKRPILIERGSFRPITTLTAAILANARARFAARLPAAAEPVVLTEITLRQLQTGDRIEHTDFLARVDTLGRLGHPVMISNYLRYHRLMPFLRRLTAEPVGFALGLRNVRELFDESFYTDLPGGILQALGRLFQGDVRLYVCPAIHPKTGRVIAPDDFQAADHLAHLYDHLRANHRLETIPVPEELLAIHARDVLQMIQGGNPAWERFVPAPVAQLVKERGYFGYQA